VLDYKLRINDTGNSQVAAISAALKKAKFRWNEIDVGSSNVQVTGSRVTITLNEPLLKGLHWELSYPDTVFTDKAGNKAPALASHEFWTSDAQVPVIRVNRRSYDARAVGNGATPDSLVGTPGNNNIAYPGTPAVNTGWAAGTTVTDVNGWGISDFNTIHYRIESETPGAVLRSTVYGADAAARRTNRAGVTAAFSGNVYDTNNANQVANSAWNATTQTNGTWILSNLVRRSNSTYTVTENGNTTTRTWAGTYYGFRSYNQDPTKATLDGILETSYSDFTSTTRQSTVTFGALEAGKAYIVAYARRTSDNSAGGTTIANTTSKKGYEGVFRTVIALLNDGNLANVGNNRAVFVEGSNVKNGMPSIAGFPVQDAAETGDNRFIKMFYRNSGNTSNAQLVWVSTEIVCEWYFIKWGGRQDGSTHMSDGEVNNYLTVGYGDLSYGYNLRSNND